MIRVRKNAHVTSQGCTKGAGTWIRSLPVGAVQRRRRRVGSYGHRLFLTSLNRESDDLLVVSDHPFEAALGVYGECWGIETLFSTRVAASIWRPPRCAMTSGYRPEESDFGLWHCWRWRSRLRF